MSDLWRTYVNFRGLTTVIRSVPSLEVQPCNTITCETAVRARTVHCCHAIVTSRTKLCLFISGYCGSAFGMETMTVSSRSWMTLSVTKERSEILVVAWLSHHDASPTRALQREGALKTTDETLHRQGASCSVPRVESGVEFVWLPRSAASPLAGGVRASL